MMSAPVSRKKQDERYAGVEQERTFNADSVGNDTVISRICQ